MSTRIFASAALWIAVASHTAAAATADHQHCYKIRDGLAGGSYAADLVPADNSFPLAEGCTIKLPAKLMCIGVEAADVAPPPPGAEPGAKAPMSLCYKVKCPDPTDEVRVNETDAFGTRAVTLRKSALVCAPIPQPEETTTTTASTAATTSSTTVTTTTMMDPCVPACGAVPHGQTSCVGDTCEIASCDAGYADCDGNTATGCETNTDSDANNCGGCALACDLPHTSVHSCTAGVCEVVRCDPQEANQLWADCNSDRTDGCEHDAFDDPDMCGSACEECASGECSLGACVP
jgi:hypothetical protein